MPSIERLPPIALEYRRAHLVAFWIVWAAILWLAIAAGLSAAGARGGWAAGASGAALAIVPGLVWRPWFELGVRLWNGVTWRLAAALRRYALAIVYFVMVAPVAACGSPIGESLPRTRTSGWRTRAELGFADPAGLAAFARHSGRGWAFCLMPAVLLLSVLRDDAEAAAPPAGTYTLY
jgi:hypothetical protein